MGHGAWEVINLQAATALADGARELLQASWEKEA